MTKNVELHPLDSNYTSLINYKRCVPRMNWLVSSLTVYHTILINYHTILINPRTEQLQTIWVKLQVFHVLMKLDTAQVSLSSWSWISPLYSCFHLASLSLASPYWISHRCQILRLYCHSLAVTIAKFSVCMSAVGKLQLNNSYLLWNTFYEWSFLFLKFVFSANSTEMKGRGICILCESNFSRTFAYKISRHGLHKNVHDFRHISHRLRVPQETLHRSSEGSAFVRQLAVFLMSYSFFFFFTAVAGDEALCLLWCKYLGC